MKRSTERLVVILSVLAGLALGEAAARLFRYPRPMVTGWRTFPLPPEELNELGFRGNRDASDRPVTVLLLGDSQVEARSHPLANMPETYLAETLRAKGVPTPRVVSVAAPGWGQDQQLLALREALPRLRPRIVALWLTTFNDLWNNTFPTHAGRPKPTFWLDGAGLSGPNHAWLSECPMAAVHILAIIQQSLGLGRCDTDAKWERNLPRAYQLGAVASGTPTLQSYLARERGISEKEVGLENENFATEKNHYSVTLVPRSARLEYSIRLTRALLAAIESETVTHGAKFVLFTDERDLWLPREPTVFQVSATGSVTLSMDAAERLVADVASGFPFLKVGGFDRSTSLSRIDPHFNDPANRRMMEEVGSWLAPQLGTDALSASR